jgi:hypothetical protein
MTLDFGEVVVGQSASGTAILSNQGSGIAKIGSMKLADDPSPFAVTSPTPAVASPKQSFGISATFSPVSVGRFQTKLVVTLTDGVSKTVLTLTGVGVTPGSRVDIPGAHCDSGPGSLSFGGVAVSQSDQRPIDVLSTGTSTLTITGASIAGTSNAFTLVQDPRGARIAPGGRSTITVQFKPEVIGPDSATLTVDFTGSPSIQIPLCGVGTAAAICAHPVPLDLGSVALMQSKNGSLFVQNCGTQSVSLMMIGLSNDASHMSDPGFSVTPASLPVTLAPGGTSTVGVGFRPRDPGRARGFVRVAYQGASADTVYFPIIARGYDDCGVTVLPMEVDYHGVAVGMSQDKRVLVSNGNAIPCTIGTASIAQGADAFSLISPPTFPATLLPGDSDILTVRYTPLAGGSDHGRLVVDSGRVPPTVLLNGDAPVGPGCHLEAMPPFIAFGIVPLGSIAQRSTRVTNISSSGCTITSQPFLLPTSDPGFLVLSANQGALAPGQSTDVNLSFEPLQNGRSQGTLRITSDDVQTPIMDLPISAVSPAPGICVDPTHLIFDTDGQQLPFQISACGGRDVMVNALPWTQPDPHFTLVNPPLVPFRLPAGQIQTVVAQFHAIDPNGATAVVEVQSDDPVTPNVDVTMQGGVVQLPPQVGNNLYFWQSEGAQMGDIMRYSLQNMGAAPQPFWGTSTNHGCVGCHTVSPDGRYVALSVAPTFTSTLPAFHLAIIDTTTYVEHVLPFTSEETMVVSWRPDVNTNPPYQFAYEDDGTIMIGSLSTMIGPLHGADTQGYYHKMPSWGPNGKIAFARSQTPVCLGGFGSCLGLDVESDIMTVDEAGGSPVAVVGASGNHQLNYYPTFSPSGDWIAYTVSRGMAPGVQFQGTYAAPDAQIRIVKSDQSGRVLTLPRANGGTMPNSWPSWSIDGTLLSFSSKRTGGRGSWDIWYVPIDPMTGMDGAPVNLSRANTMGFEHIARWSR